MWLADYRLACQLGSVDDDLHIIRILPLFLADNESLAGTPSTTVNS
jgi:hypothetical protein